MPRFLSRRREHFTVRKPSKKGMQNTFPAINLVAYLNEKSPFLAPR
jgi:hypothetical protein